jgi:hypothetical protein
MTSGQVLITRKLQSPESNGKYKTELCRNWMSGFCSFESQCVFAHGKDELRGKYVAVLEKSPKEPEPVNEPQPSPILYKKRRLPVFVALANQANEDPN